MDSIRTIQQTVLGKIRSIPESNRILPIIVLASAAFAVVNHGKKIFNAFHGVPLPKDLKEAKAKALVERALQFTKQNRQREAAADLIEAEKLGADDLSLFRAWASLDPTKAEGLETVR